MVLLAGEMERRIETLPDRDRYASVYAVLKLLPPLSAKYADGKCGSAYTGSGYGGASRHDQSCDYHAREMQAAWETSEMLIADAEPL